MENEININMIILTIYIGLSLWSLCMYFIAKSNRNIPRHETLYCALTFTEHIHRNLLNPTAVFFTVTIYTLYLTVMIPWLIIREICLVIDYIIKEIRREIN